MWHVCVKVSFKQLPWRCALIRHVFIIIWDRMGLIIADQTGNNSHILIMSGCSIKAHRHPDRTSLWESVLDQGLYCVRWEKQAG